MFDGHLWRPRKRTITDRDGSDAASIAFRRALFRQEDLDDDPLFARFCETLRREAPRSMTQRARAQ